MVRPLFTLLLLLLMSCPATFSFAEARVCPPLNVDKKEADRTLFGLDAIPMLEWEGEQGDVCSLRYLGNVYSKSSKPNYEEAYFYFSLAVALGEQSSVSERDGLAKKLTAEQIIAQAKRALVWRERYRPNTTVLREKAARGDIGSQRELGYIYYEGRGLKKNDAESLEWFLKAAEQGDSKAQSMAGHMYAGGHFMSGGVGGADYKTAMKWYLQAANQGDTHAMVGIGGLYKNGRGMPENYEEAEKWFCKAFEKGDLDALRQLHNPDHCNVAQARKALEKRSK